MNAKKLQSTDFMSNDVLQALITKATQQMRYVFTVLLMQEVQ